MTEKLKITIDELKEKIDIIYERATAKITHFKLSYSPGIDGRVNLDEGDPLYNHIGMLISKDINITGDQERLGEYLYIKKLMITYTSDETKLQITAPNKFIDKLQCEDLEFHYSGTVFSSMSPMMHYIFLEISTSNCLSVQLTRCATKSNDMISLQYAVPNVSIALSHINVDDCSFSGFCIKMDSGSESTRNLKTRENESLLHEVAPSMKLLTVFGGNSFRHFMIKLSKSEYEYNAIISNGNDIQELTILEEYPNIITWGTKEKIGEGLVKEYSTKKNKYNIPVIGIARRVIENNKATLMIFKKLTADKGDKFQESTINYHIAKCDEYLVRLDGWKDSVQDKLIMFAGKILSRHGTSWLRPLTWIVSINFIAGIIVFHILNNSVCQHVIEECNFWHIFGETFNPLSTPTGIAEDIKGDGYDLLEGPYIGLAISVLLSKAFYAMCIYEFVRAARRFTLK